MFQPVCEDRSQCPHLPKKRHGIDYLGQSVTGVESVPRDEQCDPCGTEYY